MICNISICFDRLAKQYFGAPIPQTLTNYSNFTGYATDFILPSTEITEDAFIYALEFYSVAQSEMSFRVSLTVFRTVPIIWTCLLTGFSWNSYSNFLIAVIRPTASQLVAAISILTEILQIQVTQWS